MKAKKDEIVFVAGSWVGEEGKWAIIGVFENEKTAVKTCTDSKDFVGPVPLNKELPAIVWPDLYYPISD